MIGQTHTTEAAEAVLHHSPENTLLKITLLVASSLTVLAGAIISPALPAIEAHFAADVPDIAFWSRLVLTIPALFIVLCSPIVGYLVDRVGRKSVLIAATLLYGIVGGAGYFAVSLPMLLVSRALLGLAVAGVMTSTSTLISDYYVGLARSRFIGLQTAFMGIGGTVFLSLGGLLAESNWRAPFLIYLFAFIVAPLVILVLYEPEPISAAVASAQASDPAMRLNRPLLQLIFFIYGMMLVMQAVFYLVPVQFPFHLRALNGAPASQSGMAVALLSLSFSVTSAFSGWMSARFQRMTLITIGFLLSGLGYILIGQATNWVFIIIGLMLGGIGFGFVAPALSVWLANEAPPPLRGRILGGLTTALFLGQFLSPILSQPLIPTYGLNVTYALAGGLLMVIGGVFLAGRGRIYSETAA